jgi:signal transduction histidine kinase
MPYIISTSITINPYELLIILSLGMQIPIIALIAFDLNKARKFFQKEYSFELKWIFWGWIFNFAYILLYSLQKTIYFNSIPVKLLNSYQYNSLILLFDFLYAYCFLIGTKYFHSLFKSALHLILFSLIIISYFFIYDYELFYSAHPKYVSLLKIGKAAYFIFAFISLLIFFRKLEKISQVDLKNYITYNIFRKDIYFISIGILIYLFVQINIIFSLFFKYYDLGFIFSLPAKIIILIGINRILFINAAHRSYELEILKQKNTFSLNLRDTLGQTYHDMYRPLRNLENAIKTLLRKKEKEISYSYKAESLLTEIEKIFETVIAIYSAQKIVYKYIIDNEELSLESMYLNQPKKMVRVNKLIQIVFIVLKREIEEHNILIKTDYSGNCNICCNQNQIIRIITNLVKNSIDAIITSNNKNGIIFVRTKKKIAGRKVDGAIVSQDIDDKIVVQISDNGIGISKENLHNVFNSGFTTKPVGDGELHGYGMTIVKEFLNSHDASINIESPYSNPILKTNNGGTNISMEFPTFTEGEAVETILEENEPVNN